MTPFLKISVVTVTYNSQQFIEGFIESVYDNLTQHVEEVVIVDNESTDRTAERIERLSQKYPTIKLIKTGRNQGYRHGANIGITEAKNPIIMLSNPDIIIPDGSVVRCIEIMKNSQVALCSPKVMNYDTGLGPIEKATSYFLNIVFPFLLTFPQYDEDSRQPPNHPVWTDLPIGAFLLLKKEDYFAVGGLDQNVSFYGEEEEELSVKFSHLGKRIVFCPQAKVYHVGNASVKTLSKWNDFLTYNTYWARAYLYYKYCHDNRINRMMWWLLLLMRAMRGCFIQKSSYPLTVYTRVLSQIRLTKFDENIRMECKWRPSLFVRTVMLSLRLNRHDKRA